MHETPRLIPQASNFSSSSQIERIMERFMDRSALKGVTLALIKNEKLVYTQSFGWADQERDIPCSPTHLFRIASVSKLITAVGIMKLVEEGKMNLDDPVFGPNGFFNEPEYLEIKDHKLKQITVKHLLNHTSGWTQRYGDPMFNSLEIAQKVGVPPPATLDTYLRFVISRRLYYSPGSTYSYSNMGYLFLGAIIEKVSGMRYEDYIRYKILYPNGIYNCHIGGSRFEERRSNEARYYEQEGSERVLPFDGDTIPVPKTYGGNPITLLGAAGGWIASAPDLARFLCLIDGFDQVPDILSPESIRLMTPTGTLEKPLGWKETNEYHWYRTGSFAGSAAMLCRCTDGIEWVFLTNTSSWKGPDFSKDIVRLMNQILKRVKQWPETDLFSYYRVATDPLVSYPGNYPYFSSPF